MKKNIAVKVMAFLALFGIIIGVVGTAAILIFGQPEQEIPKEKFTVDSLQKMVDNGTIKIGTGETK